MDGSTIVAIIAAVIALVAAGFAWWQALSAKRQAVAAEESTQAAKRQAEAAERSLELAQEQWDDEKRDRAALGLAQARMMHVEIDNFGALRVTVTNYGEHPVFCVELDNIVAEDAPTLPWKFNSRTIGADTVRSVVEPNDKAEFWIEFQNPDGSLNRSPGERYDITVRYTDWLGQRWQRDGNGNPERVDDLASSC
ncbi:hypothetical protein [Kutzneria chonburiensis]|uniref:DUF4352 domain-containing protein n=1 Tax=Kutzneria chonburiensis TaxID=1483604 RepID=A0ABV6MZH4_9PSEU|nr:hypothetical protein [Kutzneria chonburiensis]